MMEKYEWNFRSIMSVLITFDLYSVIALLPWALVTLAYQGLILVQYEKASSETVSFFWVNVFLSILTVATALPWQQEGVLPLSS